MSWKLLLDAEKKEIIDNQVLLCHRKLERIFKTPAHKAKSTHDNFVEKSITEVESTDCDSQWRMAPSEIRQIWLAEYHIEERNPEALAESKEAAYKYTYGDIFCGGGGMGYGAQMAGFRVKYGVDKGPVAAKTFRKNLCKHPDSEMIFASVDHFNTLEGFHHVDHLHASPPCPSFSPMQTVKPKREKLEEQQDPIFALGALLEKTCPRTVSVEETFGLLHTKYKRWFHSVVETFVAHGYNVRWRIVNLAFYGVPHKRRRLIVLASA